MVDFIISSGAETLHFDSKDRTVLHYSILLNCDKMIVQMLIDFNSDLDRMKAHTKEANYELNQRPLQKFD